jgi:hypothetical protein
MHFDLPARSKTSKQHWFVASIAVHIPRPCSLLPLGSRSLAAQPALGASEAFKSFCAVASQGVLLGRKA